MYFNSFSSFIAMDGHGAYVWAAYGVAFLIMLYNLMAPIVGRKQLMTQLRRQRKVKTRQQRVRRLTLNRSGEPVVQKAVVEEGERL